MKLTWIFIKIKIVCQPKHVFQANLLSISRHVFLFLFQMLGCYNMLSICKRMWRRQWKHLSIASDQDNSMLSHQDHVGHILKLMHSNETSWIGSLSNTSCAFHIAPHLVYISTTAEPSKISFPNKPSLMTWPCISSPLFKRSYTTTCF